MSAAGEDTASKNYLLKIVNVVTKTAFDPDAELIKYEKNHYCDKKLGFMGDHFTLDIQVKVKNQSKSKTFFIKIFPQNGHPLYLQYMESTGVFLQESEFFNEIVPHFNNECPNVKKFLPQCYYADDKSIVLEDLRLHGFRMNENIFFDKDNLIAAVEAQARLHAVSVLVENKLGLLKILFLNLQFFYLSIEFCK